MKADFVLNERLAAGCYEVCVFHRCRILLKNEANFPWLIVVPEVPLGIEDMHQLSEERYIEVMKVIREISKFSEKYFLCEKLNVAYIGNLVRQMHIHIVARSPGDAAWPGVVWSFTENRVYEDSHATEIVKNLQSYLLEIR